MSITTKTTTSLSPAEAAALSKLAAKHFTSDAKAAFMEAEGPHEVDFLIRVRGTLEKGTTPKPTLRGGKPVDVIAWLLAGMQPEQRESVCNAFLERLAMDSVSIADEDRKDATALLSATQKQVQASAPINVVGAIERVQ